MKQLLQIDVMSDLARVINASNCTEYQGVVMRQALDYGNKGNYVCCMRGLVEVAAHWDVMHDNSDADIHTMLEHAAVSQNKLANDCYHLASYQLRLGNHLNAIAEVIDGLELTL